MKVYRSEGTEASEERFERMIDSAEMADTEDSGSDAQILARPHGEWDV